MIRGIPQTKAALKRIELEIRAAAPKAAQAGATVVGRQMISAAPKRTGQLASSIRVDVSGETAKVGPEVPYARFVEFGTRYMSAQPFEQQAADEGTSSIVAAIASVLKAAIH